MKHVGRELDCDGEDHRSIFDAVTRRSRANSVPSQRKRLVHALTGVAAVADLVQAMTETECMRPGRRLDECLRASGRRRMSEECDACFCGVDTTGRETDIDMQ